MEQGYIRLNKSPYGLSILSLDRRDKKLLMCIDNHTLNKMTIKNNYPLPRIDNIFYHLNGAFYFSWINLKSGYYQIRVEYADVEKIYMRTKYSSYDFLVMPFGLCIASTTFTTLMNSIFRKNLNKSVIIYINDILVYSKFVEEHVTNFKFVLQKLKENKLHANKAKI
jgi:hypothetical protein